MRDFLLELGLSSDHCPSRQQICHHPFCGGVCHKRSKHSGLEFDKFREYVDQKELEIYSKETDMLAADMFTKSLPPEKFTRHRDEIMGGEMEQLYFLSFRGPLLKE